MYSAIYYIVTTIFGIYHNEHNIHNNAISCNAHQWKYTYCKILRYAKMGSSGTRKIYFCNLWQCNCNAKMNYNRMMYTTIYYNTTYNILQYTKMLLKYHKLQQYTTIQFDKLLYTATAIYHNIPQYSTTYYHKIQH